MTYIYVLAVGKSAKDLTFIKPFIIAITKAQTVNQITFKSFLSHRYKSADVNLYFFNLFKEFAEVQFEVDEGQFSTNVTRLEKMIRDCDAFIGIYPFSNSDTGMSLTDELRTQSKYFRLEIDLAIRSQKPAIIFYDRRYGNLIKPPDNIFSYPFDANELTSSGGFPSLNKHKEEFLRFLEAVSRKKHYDDIQIVKEKNTIAVILSQDLLKYAKGIKSVLENQNSTDIQILETPLSLDNKLFRLLETVDFAIVDHGDAVAASGIPAYLHGRFIPMIRVKYCNEDSDLNIAPLNTFLYEGVEVGYKKDLLKFDTEDSLLNGLSLKLAVINSRARRINTVVEAIAYFKSATLRKEVVFVSYSGKDIDIAKDIINCLKNHYQTVFDYRDGKSIAPGQPWLAEIFEKLAQSAIGINLLSTSYIESGNCMHEAQQMVAHLDSGKMKLFPIKLYSERFDLPEFFGMTQYLRVVDYSNIKDLVCEIVRLSSI